MDLKGLMLRAIPLGFAAALTACDAHAQVPPRDCSGRDEASGEVARVLDGRSFLLADGREVRLAAVEAPLPVPGDEDEDRMEAALASKAALETLLLHREVDLSLAGSGPDRYGRLIAYAFVRTVSGEALVQHEMVAIGQAVVAPAAAAATCRSYLLGAERNARSAKFGLWGDRYHVLKQASDSADVLAEQGRFALVRGKVLSVRESGGIVYVNFGRRRSDQLTVTILKRNEGTFVGAGVTPKGLAGRNVEVRGWVEERGGPAIEATRPEQIEVVN